MKEIVAGGKILDHMINMLLEADVDEIYVAGSYECNRISDYCSRKSALIGHSVK
jgi:NDP-sugar pyrophosphorylase family protein